MELEILFIIAIILCYVHPILTLFPFFYICKKGHKSSVTSLIVITLIWTLWNGLLAFPMYFLIGKYFILGIYAPTAIIKASQIPILQSNSLFLISLYLLWDLPLLFSALICSYFNIDRFIGPFYSEVYDNMIVGSIPLVDDDIDYLKKQDVTCVVNMCREWSGCIDAYKKNNIIQLHLPTPDICDPSLHNLKKGCEFIESQLNYNNGNGNGNGKGNGRKW